MRQSNFVTKCDRLLLKSASDITKRDVYYKVRRNTEESEDNLNLVNLEKLFRTRDLSFIKLEQWSKK